MCSILDYGYRRYMVLRNWRNVVKKLKKVVNEVIGDARVYVFGSILSNKFTAASDIDVLVVSPDIPQNRDDRIRLQLLIEDKLNLDPNPIELHLVTPEESEWYFKNLRIKYIEI